MDGPQTVSALRTMYARCASYQDSGEATTVFIYDKPSADPRATTERFATYFTRPGRFRFEYENRHARPEYGEAQRAVVWEQNGEARHSPWPHNTPEPTELRLLLAACTGVIGAAAHRVPSLLLPDRIQLIPDPVVHLAGVEDVDSARCHRLEMTWPRQRQESWWIGVDDLLLRKTLCRLRLPHTPYRSDQRANPRRPLHRHACLIGRPIVRGHRSETAPKAARLSRAVSSEPVHTHSLRSPRAPRLNLLPLHQKPRQFLLRVRPVP